MRYLRSLPDKIRERAFAPVDIASLVFFRIAFGLLMVGNVCRYFTDDLIARYWIQPRFLFKYHGFSWVQPWPDTALYIHFALLGVFAAFIAAGFLYRISIILFFLSYTYFFLLDQGNYVNHTYLIVLLSFLLIFMPANRAVSVDAWLKPKLKSNSTPAWTLWLLRAQIGVVYFFAGLTKLSSTDWLRGEPLRGWIAARPEFAVLGRFTREEWVVYLTSYGGMALDLLIVPLLLWRRTRVAAFCLAVFFHLSNAWLFQIDIFPWLGIAATSLFFSPSWPRRVISLFRRSKEFPPLENGTPLSRRKQMVILGLVIIYISIQLVVPVRHRFTRGGIEWTYLQPTFSWQMMLRQYSTFSNFYITDPNNGRTWRVSPRQHLSLGQTKRMGWRPDMVVQFAHYLASTKLPAGPIPLKVETRFFVSVHGRKPQLFIDPTVNLAAEPRIWGRPRWLLEVDQPLPPPGQENRANPYLTTFEDK